MSVNTHELPSTYSIALEDGTVLNRFSSKQYCFSTGFKDLDEFFGLENYISDKDEFTSFTKISTACEYVLYVNVIRYGGNKSIPIDENSLRILVEYEMENKSYIESDFTYEDDEVIVRFVPQNIKKTSILFAIKSLNIVLSEELNISNTRGPNIDNIKLINRWKDRLSGIKVYTVNCAGHDRIELEGCFTQYGPMISPWRCSYLITKDGKCQKSTNIGGDIYNMIFKGEEIKDNYKEFIHVKRAKN